MAIVEWGSELNPWGGDLTSFGGDTGIVGQIADVLNDDTLLAIGLSSVYGVAADTLNNDALSAIGLISLAGSASVILADDSIASAGLAGSYGSVNAFLNDDVIYSSGISGISGSAADALNDDILLSSGISGVSGGVVSFLAGDLIAASGKSVVNGSTYPELSPIQYGMLEAQWGGDVNQFGGVVGVLPSLPLVDDVISSYGSVSYQGKTSVILSSDLLSAIGNIGITGYATSILADDILNSSGKFVVIGSIFATLVSDKANAIGSVETIGGGLNVLSLADQFQQLVNQQMANFVFSPIELSAMFAQFYINYAEQGNVRGGLISAGGQDFLLNGAFLATNSYATIDSVANGLANYWNTFIAKGSPAHGGTVVTNVSVNVSSARLRTAIEGSITNIRRNDGMLIFHQAIESVVKTTPWKITELVNGTNITFDEYIT